MALNGRKCHFMCLGKDTGNETFNFKDLVMKNSEEQAILGATTDNKIYFNTLYDNTLYASGFNLVEIKKVA